MGVALISTLEGGITFSLDAKPVEIEQEGQNEGRACGDALR
jgi:hypothetical protein